MSPEHSGPLLLVAGRAGSSDPDDAVLALYELTTPGELARVHEHPLRLRPLCLIAHPRHPVVYVADGSGRIAAVDLRSGAVGFGSSGGATPCHLALTPTARHLLAANYDTGTLSVSELDPDGALGTLSQVVPLKSSSAAPSHPHHIELDHSGQRLHVTDLGTDVLHTFLFDQDTGRVVEQWSSRVEVTAGSGPRSLVRDAYGDLWCSNELASTVTRYRPDPATGTLAPVGTWPSTQSARGGVTNFAGSITSSPDGQYVYVVNRGLDTVTVFATDPTRAGPLAELGSGGAWPSDLLTHASWLFVANRDSHDVTRFEVDARTGLLGSPTTVVRTPHPGCLLLWSRPCP